MKYILSLLILLLSSTVWGSPSPTGASGTFANGQIVNITGSGFGSGPTIRLFDQFNGGPSGSTIPLSSPSIGAWSDYGSTPHPTYNTIGHSPPYSDVSYANGGQSILKVNFPSATEAFVSYWVQIPPGTYYPYRADWGEAPPVPPAISVNSSWKVAWLLRTELSPSDGTGTGDMCIPTHTDAHGFRFTGNSGSPSGTLSWDTLSWFQYYKWIRMVSWIKADPSNPTTEPGTFYEQTLVEGTPGIQRNTWTTYNVFASNTLPPVGWTGLQIPGWMSPNMPNSTPLYDDVYVATGPNAAARVEIGDSSTYANCSNIALLTPTSWSSGSITATVRQGSFTQGQQVYVFVTDANNNTAVLSSGGTPISFTVGSGISADTTPPTMTSPSPNGTVFGSGTTGVTLSVSASDVSGVAGCKYSTTDPRTSGGYASMPYTMTQGSGSTWQAALSGLTTGSYTYYIECQDSSPAANATTTPAISTFSVSTPIRLSTDSNWYGGMN